MAVLTWDLRNLHPQAALVPSHKLQSPRLNLVDLLRIDLVPSITRTGGNKFVKVLSLNG